MRKMVLWGCVLTLCVLGNGALLWAQSSELPTTQQLERSQAQFMQARQSYVSKNYQEAISQFQSLLKDPMAKMFEPQALYYLGRSYFLNNQSELALATYAKIQVGGIAALLARYEVGNIYGTNADYEMATSAYTWLKDEATRTPNHFDLRFADGFSASYAGGEEKKQSYRSIAAHLSEELADQFPREEAEKRNLPKIAYPTAATPTKEPMPTLLEMGKDGVSRPTITYKEKARYTEIARFNLVQGAVVLNVVFASNGEIQRIRLVRGLPDGLIRQAMLAASKIRFQPATKDGQPVSVRGNLEFSFNLY